ncbi:hypothetical protein C1637_12290 [Chryseobacterium lactis]|uniref:DUF7683 domain-containing protein n=1 Tax=Chryseobacterium lactis TaxID=1241981 RepID=A0A3G6RUY7_CHRLC|nr:hypothetical protein [Chryseobacterium lactis]AZA80694.1 hypothetical protein EG342_01650 [Chryseobacterium lactis]AZB05696.1 hypothetical protein EG341_17775 [Chryseobacterium lactis]PNW13584.1 hypothetical protein C1637_12290 [Chryseobacterium lactis]
MKNMEHKIRRVIEEYSIIDEFVHKDYTLNITAKEILKVLDDLILYEDDNENEIYDQYDLTKEQIEKLKPFLENTFNEDFDKYIYQLACYGEDE